MYRARKFRHHTSHRTSPWRNINKQLKTLWKQSETGKEAASSRTPTFTKNNSESYIDITLATQDLARKVKDWEGLTEERLSLYAFIRYSIGNRSNNKLHRTQPSRAEKVDKKLFQDAINMLLTEPSYTLKKLTEKIRTAQEISSIRKANSSDDQPYWWNENIASLRRDCNTARRVWKRIKMTNDNQENNTVAENLYKVARKKYKDAINREKKRCWKTLCEEINEECFGQAYKNATRELRTCSPYEITTDAKRKIVRELFSLNADEWIRNIPAEAQRQPQYSPRRN
ncbi:hypothetical protein JTB14_017969 [Gonioctena quinquepunctata]|nr:hypothetical protein JTB14_017969 [Gonioctena quinquepunctata]